MKQLLCAACGCALREDQVADHERCCPDMEAYKAMQGYKAKPIVFLGGQYYACDARGVHDRVEAADVDPTEPVLVVCRRLADFPFDRVPATCAIGRCAQCRAPIVYDPSGPHHDEPKLCMQCVGVEPLPFEVVQ